MIVDMPASVYLADPAPEPSLSSHGAWLMLTRSPAHLYHQHPRLGGAPARHSPAFDLGSAVHAAVLEGERGIVLVEAEDYRSKEARAVRDAAYEAGQIAVLNSQISEVRAVAAAVREKLAKHREAAEAFGSQGRAEQSLLWQEGDIYLRARPDWARPDWSCIYDLKTTSRSANPEAVSRSLWDTGAHVQGAFYQRGVRALGLHPSPLFRLVYVEIEPPHEVSVLQLAPAAEALAEAQVEEAIALWRRCLKSGQWPGYPDRIAWVDAPPWLLRAEEAKAGRADFLQSEQARLAAYRDWQAPLDQSVEI